jgi:hypothetical protein
MRRVLSARSVQVHTDDELEAWWRDHYIHVRRDDECCGNWYIIVKAPSGCYVYDGWWADSDEKTVEQAVAEAFDGACLLEEMP